MAPPIVNNYSVRQKNPTIGHIKLNGEYHDCSFVESFTNYQLK